MADELPSPLRVPYKTVNTTEIPTDVHIPSPEQRNAQHELAPVLIMIHGGGWSCGHSSMNNVDQIADSVARGWIVLSIEHRLCPGVDILEGGMTDSRDCLAWAQTGGLARALEDAGSEVRPDPERVMAMGTSAGGQLALNMAWDVVKPPLAILDFYGAKNFADVFWTSPIVGIQKVLPPYPPPDFFAGIYAEKETYMGGIKLGDLNKPNPTGNRPPPDFSCPRQALVVHALGNGKLTETIWPRAPQDFHLIDPYLNISKEWPPVCIVHGNADFEIPMYLSRMMEVKLKEAGVEIEFIEVDGEPHSFARKMVKGSKTWDRQREGFDWLESVVERSYGSK